jgi:hypothetical protein
LLSTFSPAERPSTFAFLIRAACDTNLLYHRKTRINNAPHQLSVPLGRKRDAQIQAAGGFMEAQLGRRDSTLFESPPERRQKVFRLGDRDLVKRR